MVASALLVDLASWRWLFALPVALAIGALVMTLSSIPNSHERTPGTFDIGGSLLSLLGIGGLVLAIHEGPARGWTEPISLAAIFLGVSATVGFWVWERRRPHPLLDVTVFPSRRSSKGGRLRCGLTSQLWVPCSSSSSFEDPWFGSLAEAATTPGAVTCMVRSPLSRQ